MSGHSLLCDLLSDIVLHKLGTPGSMGFSETVRQLRFEPTNFGFSWTHSLFYLKTCTVREHVVQMTGS